MLPLLITGIGRSGTTYLCRVLQIAGVHAGHEMRWPKGHRDNPYTVVVSWRDIRRRQMFGDVWHVTRDPLKTISSLPTLGSGSFNIMFKYIQSYPWQYLKGSTRDWMERSMWVYILWNIRINHYATYRFKIEDIGGAWSKIQKRLSITGPLPYVPKNINTRKHDDYSWEDLSNVNFTLAQECYEMGKQYNY